MACIEFNPQTCSSSVRGTMCSASYTGYIAVSVNANVQNCSFQYTVYIDRYDNNLKVWNQVWSEQGIANKNHDYLTSGSTFRTFRARIYTWASQDMHTGASFLHKG